MNPMQFSDWIHRYRQVMYEDAIKDATTSTLRVLADDFGFKDEQISEILSKRKFMKQIPKLIVGREKYREIVNSSKEKINEWLMAETMKMYDKGTAEATKSIFDVLEDKFAFTKDDIKKLSNATHETMQAINLQLVTANEIQDGLAQEGLKSMNEIER